MQASNRDTARPRTIVLGNIHQAALDILGEFSETVVIPEPPSRSAILSVIDGADAILHKFGYIDNEIMSRQRKLKIIARHGVGLDLLDLESIKAHGVTVTITPDANSNAVAEAAIGLMFAVLRNFDQAQSMLKDEKRWAREKLIGRELSGTTVGIVGFGRIGQIVADRLSAFRCNLLVFDKYETAVDASPYTYASLDTLFRESEILSLHCPLTSETKHMVNAQSLIKMRDGSVIINTSRGGLIDTTALVNAAMSGKLAGAGIDVFEQEPPSFDDPIFACPNILTTPHIAAMTTTAQLNMAVNAALEIRGMLVEGKAPRHPV
jgi:D-3-phosphoglycerate dehydrogenase